MRNWSSKKTARFTLSATLVLLGIYGQHLFSWLHTMIVDVNTVSFGQVATVLCGLLLSLLIEDLS